MKKFFSIFLFCLFIGSASCSRQTLMACDPNAGGCGTPVTETAPLPQNTSSQTQVQTQTQTQTNPTFAQITPPINIQPPLPPPPPPPPPQPTLTAALSANPSSVNIIVDLQHQPVGPSTTFNVAATANLPNAILSAILSSPAGISCDANDNCTLSAPGNFSITGVVTAQGQSVPATPVSVSVNELHLGLTGMVLANIQATHISGGAPCPQNYTQVALTEDCGYGDCSGQLDICKSTIASAPVSTVVDISMTPENTHIPYGIPCAAGYTNVGYNADCGYANCYGNQNFCVKTSPVSGLAPGSSTITDFWVSPLGQHIVNGPGCPAGYEQIGTMADCGGGVCGGNQNVCVRKGTF